MDVRPHRFGWIWNGHRWEGDYADLLRREYAWWMLCWPSWLMIKRMRNAYLRLPPDITDQPLVGMRRDGIYVPPVCLFQMEPTCEDDSSVSGMIYLSAR